MSGDACWSLRVLWQEDMQRLPSDLTSRCVLVFLPPFPSVGAAFARASAESRTTERHTERERHTHTHRGREETAEKKMYERNI